MILPPYIDRPRDARPEGLRDEVLDHSYGDVRVPHGYGLGEDKSPARPLADYLTHDRATGQTCDHRGRWDALVAEDVERYGPDDELLPRAFRLRATCTGCGVVVPLEGELAAREDRTKRLPVDPLRAVDVAGRELHAQQHNGHATYGASWTVYRQRGDGRGWYAVGVLEAGQTARGRAYVIGRYGHPNSPRFDHTPVVEAPSPLGALRKLAKLDPPDSVAVPRYVPGVAANGYRGTFVHDHVPDPTTAEAQAARAAKRAAELEALRQAGNIVDHRRQPLATVTPITRTGE